MKVLILGATGMAGHMIYTYLEEQNKFDLSNIVFRNKLNESSIIVDATDRDFLLKTIKNIKPDVTINCIGALIKYSSANPANAIYLNSFLPHFLSEVLDEIKGRLIHISTDCVFSGAKGSYFEDDVKDAEDLYGKSKGLGEIINKKDLTIRTSIVGPELKTNGEGLLNWFLNQSGEINGYERSIWSGVTTLQLAKAVDISIVNNISGLYHLTNGAKINKFELLSLMKRTFGISDIIINKVDGKNVDKSIVDSRKELFVPGYDVMLFELLSFMKKHKNFYNQYKIAL